MSHAASRRTRSMDADAYAIIGGVVATGLIEVTDDLTALDGRGWWVVVVPFEGAPHLARFAERRPLRPGAMPIGRWRGPERSAWRSSLDEAGFGAAVDDIRAAIARGDVYQVNLTRRLTAPLPTDASMAALGGALALGNPAPHAAVVDVPACGVRLASASPELFLARDGDRVWSSPIKGTAPSIGEFLPKDRAENVMIVDLVRNDLGRVCQAGSISVPALLSPESHPGLAHLVSTVDGQLRADVGWPELLAASFPPGSVTGAPKLAAMEQIERLEPCPRGIYCGTIGWVDADRRRGALSVAIRTFFADEGRLCFGTGGGITWDSTADGEWAESELKAARLLGLASTSTVAPAR